MMKASIRNIVLGGMLACLTAMISVARAADPEAAPSVGIGRDPIMGRTRSPSTRPRAWTCRRSWPPTFAPRSRTCWRDARSQRSRSTSRVEAGGASFASVPCRAGSRSSTGTTRRCGRWRCTCSISCSRRRRCRKARRQIRWCRRRPRRRRWSRRPLPAERATELPPDRGACTPRVAGARGAQGPDPWIVCGYRRRHLDSRLAPDRPGGRLGPLGRAPRGQRGRGHDRQLRRHAISAGDGGPEQHRDGRGPRRRRGVSASPPSSSTGRSHRWWAPSSRSKFPIAGRFRGLLVGGFDYFARRTELLERRSSTRSIRRRKLAPYVAVVVEAGLGL